MKTVKIFFTNVSFFTFIAYNITKGGVKYDPNK